MSADDVQAKNPTDAITLDVMNDDVVDELERLDNPRGVIKAANICAAKHAPSLRSVMSGTDEEKNRKLAAAKFIYSMAFDCFIAGSQWTLTKLHEETKATHSMISIDGQPL